MATSSSTFTRGTRTWSSPAASPGTASSSPRWSGRFSRTWRCSGGRSTTSHCLPSTASPVDDASRILPTLFIGRAPATAADVAGLKRRGISAVLSLQTDDDLAALGLPWSRLEEWYRAAAIAAYRLPAAGHPVYLHCTAGVNRSPSVALGYLRNVKKGPLRRALRRITRSRPQAAPYPDVLGVLR